MSEITVNEVFTFDVTEDRFRWYSTDDIDRYIGFSEHLKIGESHPLNAEKERHFECYFENEHVADFRCIQNNDEDKQNKRAEFIIIVGKRNMGVGSKSLPKLIEAVKTYYDSIYCYIHKSNIRSMKLMKKNGFYVDEIKGSEILLVLDLD
jgi:RimJ/RimL family protein N-acetyltransferase